MEMCEKQLICEFQITKLCARWRNTTSKHNKYTIYWFFINSCLFVHASIALISFIKVGRDNHNMKWARGIDDNNPWQTAVFPLAKVACAPKPDVQDSILAQVASQLKSKTKWVQVDKTPIWGIKLWIMKEFNIP